MGGEPALVLGGMKFHYPNSASMLAYVATALAHLQADDYAHMRHMRIRSPKAQAEAGDCRRRRSAATPVAAVALGGAKRRSAAPVGHQDQSSDLGYCLGTLRCQMVSNTKPTYDSGMS